MLNAVQNCDPSSMCALSEPKGLPGGFQRGPNWRSERTAAALTDRKPAVPDLQRIAEARTPGCHASMWGSWNRKRCVFTLGSDDLRIYVAYHKPPTVFSLNRVHVRCGRSHVELSRVNWTTKLLRYICCCEPLAVIIKLKRSQAHCTCMNLADVCSRLHHTAFGLSSAVGELMSVGLSVPG